MLDRRGSLGAERMGLVNVSFARRRGPFPQRAVPNASHEGMRTMKYAVTGAIASVALLSAVSLAIAQGRDRDGRPGASGGGGSAPSAPAQRSAPRSEAPAMRSAPSVREQPRMRESSPARERAAPERQYRQRQVEPRAQPDRQLRQRQAEPRGDTSRRLYKSEDRTRERAEKQRERTDQKRQRVEQQQQRVEQRRQADQQRQELRKEQSKAADKGKEATRQDVKRVQATDEQRVRVRERLFKERFSDRKRLDRERIRDKDVRPIVGVHIPRRHRLHRLPIWIVDFAPIYRDYSYVVVEDTICIVDPETYVVVDVLPASSQRADVRELSLTREQMRFVYAEVPKETPVDIRIRLALGAEIPRNVALYTFPDHVLARIPKLESFRYVVVGDDVAIVDPADYSVVLVISG
jgi:hypothetical protein